MSQTSPALIEAALHLSNRVQALDWSGSSLLSHVYNPLDYAWPAHQAYIERYGHGSKRVIFFGMNPGPFGMVQTGVPFGEVAAVRDWLGIETPIGRPQVENPKRPIQGFSCTRSEVSGRRLWGLFADRFNTAEHFFREHFVVNWCPLAFFDQGRNLTPDKLPGRELAEPIHALYRACDQHLADVVRILQPEWVIGVGAFAESRARLALAGLASASSPKIGRMLHPSPASPAANRGWPQQAISELETLGVWESGLPDHVEQNPISQ